MRVLKEGTRLAQRYTLIRRLGAGGMAEIWLASDSQTDSRVALKFLAAGFTENEAYRDLLHREWRIGSNLMHAHIVRVFEFHDDPDGAFYSLQFISDTDLGVLCGKNPGDALPPVGLIADALRYAHAKGVVHRDIKAANILLDGRGAPYLVDFGVAAIPAADGDAGGGTDINASPQQKAGEVPCSADDIYALGVLLHELLAGAPPTAGAPVTQTLADGSAAPTAINALVNDMLASDAAARPSAEDVAQRLRDAGFAAGPAPRRYLGDAPVMQQDVLESIQPVRREFRPAVDPAVSQQASNGVSSKLLFGGLAAALVIFLGVIFVLPSLVSQKTDSTVADRIRDGQAGIADEEAAAAGEEEPAAASRRTRASGSTSFGENLAGDAGSDAARVKAATDEALGNLLSRLERLRYRAIERWGGQPYLDAVDVYAQGDEAYLARNYALAGERYREATRMLEPFFDRIDDVFAETLAAANAAFAVPDPSEAVRLFDLAVAITPGHREAEAGLKRALNLESVLNLTAQGVRFEKDIELDAAKLAFEKALELDALWEPAAAGLERVRIAIKQMSFDMRMTEGLDALAAGDFASARAAFNAARLMDPAAREPTDGLLQVELGIRLANIRRLEREAKALDEDEQWEAAVGVYKEILGIDPDLQFAKEGLRNATARTALHNKLQGLIDDPDTLSDQVNMQTATRLLLDVARVSPMGPRLEDQKNELSRLLKRAATPLKVQLVSDNATDVAIFKVGRFGAFSTRDLELRPGVYVAVGNRPGYRDVRLEFRVAPEIEMKPIVIQCEEQI
jgi:tetratricopeptide (TPR) repeat protein